MSRQVDSVGIQKPRGIFQFEATYEFITQKPHMTLHVKSCLCYWKQDFDISHPVIKPKTPPLHFTEVKPLLNAMICPFVIEWHVVCLWIVCQWLSIRPLLVHESSSPFWCCAVLFDNVCGMCCFLLRSLLPVDVCGIFGSVTGSYFLLIVLWCNSWSLIQYKDYSFD